LTIDDFRRIALSLPGACESAHQGHPDFRVGGKIFATLGYPDANWGMVKLSPDEQAMLVGAEPAVFKPVAGGWGQQGNTNLLLAAADEPTLRSALTSAWRQTAAKTPARSAQKRT
jgi:hypothetical protein